jgi:hypothetical protein
MNTDLSLFSPKPQGNEVTTQLKIKNNVTLTFCATINSYTAQIPVTVMPCSLHNIAVATEIMDKNKCRQPGDHTNMH